MEKGTKVRMSEQLKSKLRKNSRGHVEEFGTSVGVVLGPTDFGDTKGPEVDVRWPSPLSPHGYRYAYMPDELEVVE